MRMLQRHAIEGAIHQLLLLSFLNLRSLDMLWLGEEREKRSALLMVVGVLANRTAGRLQSPADAMEGQ
jgi:hypothetical protein